MQPLVSELADMSPAPPNQSPDHAKLPIVRWVLIFWVLLWLVVIGKDTLAVRLVGDEPGWFIVVDAAIWWGTWALLSPLVIHFARRWRPAGRVALVGGHLLVAALVALLHITTTATLFAIQSPEPLALANIYGGFSSFFSAYVTFNLLIYSALVITYLAVESFWKLREERLARARLAQRVAELEASTSKARLEALRRQLDPHFLFNALNAVSGLARHGRNDRVIAMLARIADLLRVTLEDPDAHEVPLRRELEWLNHYVAVELERFPNRLRFTVHAPDDIGRALVPAMVLQPLVENAIRHGVDRSTDRGDVTVTARREDEVVTLTVEDRGPGFPGGQRTPKGVGLSNTRSRLEQLYDGESSLTLENVPGGGARVTIRLPYHENPVLRPAEPRMAP